VLYKLSDIDNDSVHEYYLDYTTQGTSVYKTYPILLVEYLFYSYNLEDSLRLVT